MYMYSFINNLTPNNRPKPAVLPTTLLGFKVNTAQSSTRFKSMIDKIGKNPTKCGSCGGH